MPRTQISISETVERLSILDEHGKVDPDLEPEIPTDTLLKMYRAMLLGRRFDERMLDLQRQGRIGTFPPIKGHEASQIGSVIQLDDNDWFVPSFRETAAEILRGRSLESVLLYYNGFNEGTLIPAQQKDLPMAIPVASQVPHAVGLAYAAAYRKSGAAVMVFFGDGATSEGDFHEGLNCAAVYRSPVVFLCQNNQWAISIPYHRQTSSTTIAQKAVAYGIPGIQVDGNDILAVYAATREALERARAGEGPTLIECVTYRIMMHTTADDPSRYRTEEEVECWKKKDPLTRFETYLTAKSILTAETMKHLETEVLDQIEKGITSAEQKMRKPGDPLEMFDHLYSEPTPLLERQRQQVQESLAAQEGGEE